MKNLDIVMIIDSFFPDTSGGAELFAYEVAKRLVKKGHNVKVITKRHPKSFQLREWGKYFGTLAKYEEIEGIKIHRIPYIDARFLGAGSFIISSLFNFKNFKCDIVHAHLAVSSGMAGALIKLFYRITLLTTEQGLYDYELRFFKPLIRFCFKTADHIHVVSNDLKKKIQHLRLENKNFTIIPNGVDTTGFRTSMDDRTTIRKKLGLHNEPLILNVSRLVSKNDLDSTIRGFKTACSKVPEMKLLIIGEGPLKSNLEKLAKKLEIEKSIIFLGYIPHVSLPKYYSASDIFIRTPTDEGFGIVFIESMSSGLPTIATNVGGITDIISDGTNGILVSPHNIDSIGKSILKLVNDSEFSKRISDNARRDVERKFSWDKITNDIENLYYSMLT